MSRMLWLLPVLALGCQRLPPDTAAPPADTDVDADTDSDADTDADTDSDTDTDTDDWPTGPTVRFVHWNIEFLGSTSSDEYQAAIRVLERLNGDVVFLNEVEPEEVSALNAMADELGYDTVLFPSDNPFGTQRNALMSRLAVQALQDFSSTSLSGDGSALDVTRNPVGGVFTLPDGGEVQDFDVYDERYSRLQAIGERHVVAEFDVDGERMPAAWVRTHAASRVAVDVLGHDARSYSSTGHRDLITRLARWSTS